MAQSEIFFGINEKRFVPYISENKINDLVQTLAKRIRSDYEGRQPVFLVILKGGIFFASDLIREVGIDCQVEVIQAKSYGAKLHSSGKVDIFLFDFDIKGRDVIIVEDIVDTGLTLGALTEELQKHSTASIEIAALISKPAMRMNDIVVKYCGIEIPPVFIVGYGLDYDEKGRHLKGIYKLEAE